MFYSLAATAVLLLHLGFILFVLAGSVLATRHRWIIAIHIPAAAWGFLVELTGHGCPLTDVENFFLAAAGQVAYTGSFIEHYLLPVIYPAGLTRELQLGLASAVVAINLVMYGWLFLYRPLRAHSRRNSRPR
jgi:hypothetical protein